jgi:hypothetical protein
MFKTGPQALAAARAAAGGGRPARRQLVSDQAAAIEPYPDSNVTNSSSMRC